MNKREAINQAIRWMTNDIDIKFDTANCIDKNIVQDSYVRYLDSSFRFLDTDFVWTLMRDAIRAKISK